MIAGRRYWKRQFDTVMATNEQFALQLAALEEENERLKREIERRKYRGLEIIDPKKNLYAMNCYICGAHNIIGQGVIKAIKSEKSEE